MTLPRTSLDAARRQRDLEALAGGEVVDVLVVGGGVTGAGAALDAASRGLSVALIDRGDLASGTSGWSSKLVHGGLRYLARGEVGIAVESARERGILMERTAPHLVRAMPMIIPLEPSVPGREARFLKTGLWVGDALRLAAHTSRVTLPKPRRLTRTEALRLAPGLRAEGLRGGLIGWDGQLVDDARLVISIARTAAGYGARVVTRCAASHLCREGARVRDTLTGEQHDLRARTVVNATGVWAGDLAEEVRLRPSRGSHLVVSAARLGVSATGIMVPVPGESDRFVFALPQPDGRAYVGVTDEPVSGFPENPARAAPHEVDFLLRMVNGGLEAPLGRGDVLGTFTGLRPLLWGAADEERTADLSRRHAVFTGPNGVVTVVGGKLTTYRRMAEDAVDTAVAAAGLPAGPCRTRALPLVGAAPHSVLDRLDAPRALVRRYGTEAPVVLGEAGGADGDPALLRPLVEGVRVSGAELLFGLRHEGALDVDDLLDRRTRVGLVPAERERVVAAAREVVAAHVA